MTIEQLENCRSAKGEIESLRERIERIKSDRERMTQSITGMLSGKNNNQSRIEELTATDVTPVMHGRWEHTHTTDSLWTECWTCSICGMEDEGFISGNYNYCPHCGARMD